MKNIILNGDVHQTDKNTVLELLEALKMTQGRFAVEIDGMLIPKIKLSQTSLTDGMVIEVVQAVGGG